jgi:hypothetical protein
VARRQNAGRREGAAHGTHPAERTPSPARFRAGFLDTVRVFDIVLIVHTVLDAAGGRHHTAQFSASVSTAAGFEAKREIQTFTMQAASGLSDLEVHHATVSVAAQGPNGQVLVGRVVIHLGVRGGEPVLAFERFDFSCRGKPATSRFEGRLLQS